MVFNDYEGLRRINLGSIDRDILPDAHQSHSVGTSGNRFATVAADVAYAQRLVAPTNHMDIFPGSGQRIRLFGEVNQGVSMYDAQTGIQQFTLLHNSSNQLHLFSNAPTLFAVSSLLGPLYLYSVVGNVQIQARAGQQQVQVSGHIAPEGDTEVFDVGSLTKKWRSVYAASGVFDAVPLAHGSMYNHDTSTTVTISDNDATRIDGGYLEGQVNGMTFQNGRELVVQRAGRYKIDWSTSFGMAAGAGQEIEGGIMINAASGIQGTAHRKIANATDTGAMGGTAIYSLGANDVIALWVLNESSTNNVIVEHSNMTIVQVG